MSTVPSTETQNAGDGQAKGSDSDASQYLTFILAGEEYGVDILRVREIRGWDSVTIIPNMPEYIKGVINLRGTIVPIVDLRCRFALKEMDYGPMTVVIVVRVHADSGERTMGMVVDAVSDVYNVNDADCKEAPDFGGVIDTAFVKGLATVAGKMVILLDIDRLIVAGVLEHVSGAAN